MCSFITQHNATDVASFEGACNWHADCRNVHQNCCPWIECSVLYHKPSPKAFGSTSNRPHNHRPRITTPSQDLHIQHLHLQDRLRPTTWTPAATIGLHNQRSSAQPVINHLREAYLHIRHPYRGLDLTAARRRNLLERANAHGPPQYSKTAHFWVASLRHTCATIMPSNQHLDGGEWIILAKEKCSLTDLDRFVNNIWEK